MESNWASDNLQVIRTLMERSSLYRRALAPVMIFAGCVGTIAGTIGLQGIDSASGFVRLWILAGLIAAAGVFVLIRRQALKDVEPVWSSPTRRVVQAIIPPLFVGLVAAVPFLASEVRYPELALALIPAWFALYGCALCAAGAFMPRGIKIFGWFFILAGSALFIAGLTRTAALPTLPQAHGIMGVAFGLIHLLYGGYLYVTEPKRKNAV
ncbi:MAG: hypothetical protein H0X66_04500 [Verrucomicrobia bacterium]|nr:hypothetical protein [Verrucomicrobiota bacterium]